MIPARRRRLLNGTGLLSWVPAPCFLHLLSSVFRSVLHPLCAHRCLKWGWVFHPLCLDSFPFLLFSHFSFLGVDACPPGIGWNWFLYNTIIHMHIWWGCPGVEEVQFCDFYHIWIYLQVWRCECLISSLIPHNLTVWPYLCT